jgi:hypothetical protein
MKKIEPLYKIPTTRDTIEKINEIIERLNEMSNPIQEIRIDPKYKFESLESLKNTPGTIKVIDL